MATTPPPAAALPPPSTATSVRPLLPIPIPTITPTIKHLCKLGNLKQAFHSTLPTAPIPLQHSLAAILHLCAARSLLAEGRQLHARVITSPYPLDADFLRTKLAFFYARRVFDQIPCPLLDCSWIEVQNKVHSFTVMDKSDSQTTEIYEKLSNIYDALDRDGAYVPDTKFVLQKLVKKKRRRGLLLPLA